MLQYYLDRCEIKKVCDKAADALKSVLDLLVTSKQFEILDNTVFSNDIINLH